MAIAHEDRKTNEHGRWGGNRLRLLDTCRTGQDVFILGLPSDAFQMV